MGSIFDGSIYDGPAVSVTPVAKTESVPMVDASLRRRVDELGNIVEKLTGYVFAVEKAKEADVFEREHDNGSLLDELLVTRRRR